LAANPAARHSIRESSMQVLKKAIAMGTGVMVLAGCAATPTSPSVRVLPAPGKPFEVFASEDQYCRGYAQQSIGNASEQANAAAVGTAVIGTAVGAAAGALLGGRNGAGAGAGVGLVAGSAIGAGNSQQQGWSLQRRYDYAYEQCMYAKGNIVPGQAMYYGSMPPPPPAYAPPPPPPPPPGQ
jgi:uncharacterized protein YcfJ